MSYLFYFCFLFHFPELRSGSCGNPGVPSKGILNGTQFNVGDKIRYRCVTGYVLDGHSLLTCVSSQAGVAVWDFPVPICRGKFFPKCIFFFFFFFSRSENFSAFDVFVLNQISIPAAWYSREIHHIIILAITAGRLVCSDLYLLTAKC